MPDHADLRANARRIARDLVTEEGQVAGRRLRQRRQDPQQRALARTVGAEDADVFAGVDAQIEVANTERSSISLLEPGASE